MTERAQKFDRRALFASGAAAALLAATGVSASSQPQRGGRLRIAVSGADRSDRFDARLPMGLFMQVALQGAVFDTLTEVSGDGTLRGELAVAWRSERSATRWIFDLRPNVTFHNGAVFSSDDVVTSLELHADTGALDLKRATAVSDTQVVVDLKSSNPQFPIALSAPQFVMYPHAHLERSMEEGIGTGLYRVKKFDAGRHFIGSRVDQHYKDGAAGWFDKVELVSIPSAEVRAEALRDRLVDAADLPTATHLSRSDDVLLLPHENEMTHAVRGDIGLPVRLGSTYPMDNLRAPERWWMG